jgi:hypothetical protein
VSDDAAAGDVKAHQVGALRASVIMAISAMLDELELMRRRHAAPPDIDEFIASTAAVLARLREAAPPEDLRA